MKKALRRTLILGVVVSMCACSGGSPRILSWEIWDGEPGAPGAVRVLPQADGTLRLVKDRLYHATSTVETAGRGDRCIYRVFSYTWFTSVRQFDCTPETSKTLVMDDYIATWRGDVARVTSHRVSVSLAEFDSETRQSTFHGPSESFAVEWVE